MSELKSSLCLRWSADTRYDLCDKRVPLYSSALRFPDGEFTLYYYNDEGKHNLCLKMVSDVPFYPFDVSVHVEDAGTERIATEPSQKKRCTDRNGANLKKGKIYCWRIWWDSFSEYGHLRFLVFIRKVDATASTPADNPSACPLCRSPGTADQKESHRSIPCLESLSQDLSKYMDQGSDPDVEFHCGRQPIGAHGAIVCARSPVIASMLSSDMVEGRTRVVKVPNMEPDVFQHFLRYLYTGTLPELTVELALDLYEAGDQYAVLGLARRCSQYLLQHLSIQDACDFLIVADAHGNAEFKEAVIDFMVKEKMPQVFSGWPKFCSSHPMLAIGVLNRICNAVPQ